MSVLRSTARTLTASAVLVGTLAAPAMVHVAAAQVTPAATLPAPATTALDWLANELADGGGATGQAHVLGQTFDFGGGPTFFPDWGLTADAVMDLTLTGVHPTEATASLNNIQDHVSDYVTGGSPADRYAGALGKSLLLAEITGRNPHAFGGFDLESDLRARLQTTGITAGRFTDDAKFGDPTAASSDFSNGFGQAVDMLALTRTPGGVPASAIDFLLAQQCPGGGFRTSYDATAPAASTRGCASDTEADPDGTAIALDVLLTQPAAPGVPAATAKAIAKLVALQDAGGGFASSAGTLNANTSGLAGQALRTAGLTTLADKAAAFVASLQVTAPVAPTAADAAPAPAAAPTAADLGAFAFSVADHAAAEAAGIAAAAKGQVPPCHRAGGPRVRGRPVRRRPRPTAAPGAHHHDDRRRDGGRPRHHHHDGGRHHDQHGRRSGRRDHHHLGGQGFGPPARDRQRRARRRARPPWPSSPSVRSPAGPPGSRRTDPARDPSSPLGPRRRHRPRGRADGDGPCGARGRPVQQRRRHRGRRLPRPRRPRRPDRLRVEPIVRLRRTGEGRVPDRAGRQRPGLPLPHRQPSRPEP